MKRPITTLFMLMSIDGKISTGDSDSMDVDKDFPLLWMASHCMMSQNYQK